MSVLRGGSPTEMGPGHRSVSDLEWISYKTTGKRVFLNSPLHHHFELKGWSEVNVVLRFWIIAGMFAAIGLATFYGDLLAATS